MGIKVTSTSITSQQTMQSKCVGSSLNVKQYLFRQPHVGPIPVIQPHHHHSDTSPIFSLQHHRLPKIRASEMYLMSMLEGSKC